MSNVKIECTSDGKQALTSSTTEDRTEAIRQKAYELFLLRGDDPGNAIDDWYAAERTILGLAPTEVTENDGAYVVDLTLPGFDAGDVEVMANENEVIVRAEAKEETKGRDSNIVWREFGERAVYRRFTLPTPVSTERISANLADGVLHVHAPKSRPFAEETTELAPA
jgi:HSP20 family protein